MQNNEVKPIDENIEKLSALLAKSKASYSYQSARANRYDRLIKRKSMKKLSPKKAQRMLLRYMNATKQHKEDLSIIEQLESTIDRIVKE